MHEELTRRQGLAWCFGALGVPGMLLCAGAPWPWVLAAGCCAATYYIIIETLRRSAGTDDLCTLTRRAFGGAGRGILVLGAIWTVTALSETARQSAVAFPEGAEAALCAPILLGLCAFGGQKGTRALARAAAVLAPVLAMLEAAVLLSALPQVRWEWCAPWGDASWLWRVLPSLLLPSAVLYLPRREERVGTSWGMLAALALLPAVGAVVTTGCISPQVAAEEPLAFYTLSKSVRVLGVMERLEPVVSAVEYLSFFCIAALLSAAAGAMVRAAFGASAATSRWLSGVICAAALGLVLLPVELPVWVRTAGASTFWGMVPVVALVVVGVKKGGEKTKKGVDKW